MTNPFLLNGKKILVVGGSKGIGRATTSLCSQLGADCIVIGRNEKNLHDTLECLKGDSHCVMSVDITNKDQVDVAISELPCMDGVVLCAGIGAMKPLVFSARADFEKVFNLNFFANIEFMRLLVKKKKLSRGGSIVIVSSVGGVSNFSIGNSIYGASKAALNSMVKYGALEFASKHIRVNSVCPGMIMTDFNKPDILTQEQLDADASKYPLKRFGAANDVANGIVYLLSDASSWVTGTSLTIDGGISLV